MKMKQLAQLAGVSPSTVSKAFSGSHEVSEEKRQYIFEIAKKVGCYDKYCKAFFKKKVIGVVCPEFQGGNYSKQLTYLKNEIEKHDSVMIVGCHSFDECSKNDLISYFTESAKVDGLIVVGSDNMSGIYHTPIVVIGKSDNFDSIVLSTKSAMKNAVENLLKNGHRDIGFIGEKLTKLRFTRFVEVMEESRLRVNYDYVVESTERFEEAGYDAMNTLLSKEKRPTAVIAAYDSIAIGAMKSIYEHGLSIPDDISLIGMDDESQTAYLNVPLTSTTSYMEDLCEIVVDVLFNRIENGDDLAIRKINVSMELVERKSVGKAKSNNKMKG